MKNLLTTAIAILGLATITMAQVPSYVPTSGLVGWWPFNGNANDESVNSNDGTVTGATLSIDRFGNTNSAYSFNGISNKISIPNVAVQGSSDRTISCWIKTTSNGPVSMIISTGSSSYDNGGSFNLRLDNSNQFIGFMGGDFTSSNYDYLPTGTTVLNNGNWHCIIATYTSGTLTLYVDGIVEHTANLNLNTVGQSNFIGVSQYPSPSEDWFNGKIDDIGIWNRALTQQEITNLYNSANCVNNLTVSPSNNQLQTGSTAIFTATTSDPNPSYVWQSDLGQGFQTLNNFGNYSGTGTATLNISNVQLSEHSQPIRVITTAGNCTDTSNIAIISIADTCINSITDTTLITVTDTLLINMQITGINPPNNLNTLKVFPNPANTHITINYGNFSIMSGYKLRIENSLGQQVFQTNITQQSDYLSLTNWGGNGIYFVRIIDAQGNTIDIRKIVLQ